MNPFRNPLARRDRPGRVAEPLLPATTPFSVARQMADGVLDTSADPAELSTLRAIGRLWRTDLESLPDELVAVDTFAAEFALDQVVMPDLLRGELREEFRGALAECGLEMEALLTRQRAYAVRLQADRQQALAGGSVRGIAASVGTVFMAALGGENVLLADAVGRRFIDHAEALREYLTASVRVLGRG